jgi:hypothetical protein
MDVNMKNPLFILSGVVLSLARREGSTAHPHPLPAGLKSFRLCSRGWEGSGRHARLSCMTHLENENRGESCFVVSAALPTLTFQAVQLYYRQYNEDNAYPITPIIGFYIISILFDALM